MGEALPQKSIWGRSSCFVRVTLWIVSSVHKKRTIHDDPPSHTNQHEPKYFRFDLGYDFLGKADGG